VPAGQHHQDTVPDWVAKYGRNTDSWPGSRWDQRVGRGGHGASTRFHPSRRIGSHRFGKPRHRDVCRAGRYDLRLSDPIIQRIETFRCVRGQLSVERRGAATRCTMPTRAPRSRDCVRPVAMIVSRCSTGRSGRRRGSVPVRSAVPYCPSTRRYNSSRQRTSSGLRSSLSLATNPCQKCGTSS
jgi:hypothetical protein